MEFPTCQQCNGNGIISFMHYTGSESMFKCDMCNGYGVIRYSIRSINIRIVSDFSDYRENNVWILYSPDRTEFFIEHSFNDVIVRMDLHASKRYGKVEMQ